MGVPYYKLLEGAGINTSYRGAVNGTKVVVATAGVLASDATKTASQIVGGWIDNSANAAATYLQIFNLPTASVTVGSTVADYVIPVAASSVMPIILPFGLDCSVGIVIAATTTPGGSTNPATASPTIQLLLN